MTMDLAITIGIYAMGICALGELFVIVGVVLCAVFPSNVED